MEEIIKYNNITYTVIKKTTEEMYLKRYNKERKMWIELVIPLTKDMNLQEKFISDFADLYARRQVRGEYV